MIIHDIHETDLPFLRQICFFARKTPFPPIKNFAQNQENLVCYTEISSNNVNHPNDFMARVYAMTLLSALIDTSGGE